MRLFVTIAAPTPPTPLCPWTVTRKLWHTARHAAVSCRADGATIIRPEVGRSATTRRKINEEGERATFIATRRRLCRRRPAEETTRPAGGRREGERERERERERRGHTAATAEGVAGRGQAGGRGEGEGAGGRWDWTRGWRRVEVMVVDRFFLDTNGAISKKIFVVFADNKYRRT
jgi:hypothetical protein